MARKEKMSALVGSSPWRAPALTLMAALIFAACAPAQEDPSAAATSKEGAQVSPEQTLTRVRTLRGAGRFAAALEPLATYLASDPRNTVVRLEYARTLAILRRFQEAAREYRRVLETEPQNAAALIGLAKVASWQGQNQLALETYDRVLMRNPELYDALVGKAFVLLWMGRQEEAQALFRDAQRQHPDDPEVGRALTSLGPPTSSPMRAGAAEHPSGAAASDAKKPAASDAAGSAPAEAPKPAVTPSPATTPSTAVPLPGTAAPAATVEGWNGGEMTQETIAAPASSPGSQPVPPQPQKNSAPLRTQGARERAGVRTAGFQQQSSPAEAPKDSPSPLHIPPVTALQLAMLGMVTVVVGAIAYRTYSVRLRSATLPPRRVYELPPASPVPPPRSAAVCGGKGGPLAGRVLVVHPQQAVRDFAQQVLAGAGAEVLVLGRGEDAMVRLDRAQYDAIVISDQLPAGWSGREIYRWLERNQPGAERKFVLALADEADAEMQLFLEESRALTISTPFGVSDLLAMTRLAMARSRAQA
jgi:tetratricopeptide (TPR) repeat protein/CheY-like chemotaxis protein